MSLRSLFAPLVAALLLHAAPVVAAEPATGVLTRPPELLQFVEAPFPASETGRSGVVVLSVTIGLDGRVEEAAVSESAGPAFDAAAIEAVRQFVFSPAEVDGQPSRIRILYRYEFFERVELPTTAIFSGVVRDREAKVPLAGVTLTLADGRAVVTDAEGRFELRDVPPGPLVITLTGERLTALSTEETFVAGERLEATYDVFLNDPDEEGGDDMEILITAPALKRQVVSTEVGAEEARRVPGTQGDVLRVVENMPGVARASLGTGALVVWGAAPDDTGVYVDGVRVPRLYHDGGLRSVVGSDFVRSVELVPGGYGAGYGRGLGGLVSVKTARFDEQEGVHGSVSADLYDAQASVHGKVNERWDLGVGGRYGYVAPLLGAFYPDVEDFFPIPHYWDVQGRVGVKLRDGERLDLTGLASSDLTRRTAPNPDPAREASDEKRLDFQRVYLRYSRDAGDGSSTSAVLFGGADQGSQVSRFGRVETSIRTAVVMAGARASHRRRVTSWFTVEAGVDAEVTHTTVTREGSLAVPPREGDIRVFGQPPPDQISEDRFTVVHIHAAPWAEADLALFNNHLHIVPGLRLDPYARSVSRAAPQVGLSPTYGLFLQDLQAEPRLAVRVAPTDTSYITAAVGVYGQAPQAADLSASFGNPALPAASGTHYVLGGGVRPVATLSIDATAFYTTSRDLAMRNQAEQPARAEALVASGSGRTYGAQLMVKLDPTFKAYGWLSYTLARSERRDAPELDWRPSDYDQRHVLTALAGYELPLGFDLGLRLRVSTGYPRTEVVGAFYDNRRDLYQPVFGQHNEQRLPTFFQADLRLAKRFDIRETHLDVALEVQNLTNQKNVEEFVYDANYQTQGAIRGLPILPVLGLRWSF
jgi:TonB family protein